MFNHNVLIVLNVAVMNRGLMINDYNYGFYNYSIIIELHLTVKWISLAAAQTAEHCNPL